MKLRLLSVAIAASVSAPLYAPPALGQAGVLEEILVTAQRREEDLQSVPVAITAFTADTLDRLAISDPQAMADFVPNVSIGDGTGRANVGAQFSIRGINEARISPVLDPAVGVYIDDVYYGRPFTNFLRLLDVERVEVLRGPQGTLFGKNSTGGAIRYVTVKPDVGGDVSGNVTVGLGDYDRANVQAAVNVPLGDNAAARFAYSHLERDGYLERLSDGVGLGADDTDYFSAQFRLQPSDELTIDININRSESESNGGASKLIDYFGFNGGWDDPATPGIDGDTHAPIFAGGISNLVAYQTIFPVGTPEHYAPSIPDSLYHVAGTGPIGFTTAESTGVTLDISYDISGRLTLRSITGWRDMDTFEQRESDESSYAQSFFDGGTNNFSDFWSQEFQINGVSQNDRVNWVAGLYYSAEEPGLRLTSNKDYRWAGGFQWGALEHLTNAQQETDSTGIFAQVDWQFSESFTLTLGTRWTEDDKSYAAYNLGVFDAELDRRLFEIHAIDPDGPDNNSNYRDIDPRGGRRVLYINPDGDTYGGCTATNPCFLDANENIVPSAAAATLSGADTFESVTPRVALEWQSTDAVMLYAAASKGFKSGGTNDQPDDIDTPFQPEEVWNYEIGTRIESASGRLRANVTYFQMDYEDKQLTVTADDRCARRCTINVGSAEISGVELELQALLTDSLQFNLGAGTLDAKWDEIVNRTSGVEFDSNFSRAPDLGYNIGLTNTWDLNSGASIRASIDYAYKDEQDSSGQDSTTLRIPEYELLTLRIGYSPPDGAWNASLYCTNCADEQYITGGAAWAGGTSNTAFPYKLDNHPAYVFTGIASLNPAANAPPAITLVNVGMPRQVGVDFRYRF